MHVVFTIWNTAHTSTAVFKILYVDFKLEWATKCSCFPNFPQLIFPKFTWLGLQWIMGHLWSSVAIPSIKLHSYYSFKEACHFHCGKTMPFGQLRTLKLQPSSNIASYSQECENKRWKRELKWSAVEMECVCSGMLELHLSLILCHWKNNTKQHKGSAVLSVKNRCTCQTVSYWGLS